MAGIRRGGRGRRKEEGELGTKVRCRWGSGDVGKTRASGEAEVTEGESDFARMESGEIITNKQN